ncbi:hypothetical protein [Treponema pedis]|uniref:Uncharacterized protein n=1 Tax=Treponema pedis TaxID=409322 RepID=A0A7S6WQF7_9SPIR|nr:hypothetical protein [Treponema pedis]QOW61453.1 hypothetical protein IFE08_03430 [Treponema pedis]QSI03700.1 hypothetical protein DYQ05_01600 [Treponema pedis]
MKRQIVFILLFSLTAVQSIFPYFVEYKEQYYKLYHIHYEQNPDNIIENIYWLEQAINADFCNPLYALGKIETKKQWEKYRYLFMMHLNLKMVEQHLRLGSKFDKQAAYFYNFPWKEQNIDSLGKAEEFYKTALVYWYEAKLWAEKANIRQFQFLFLEDLQDWEDERERIADGSLNYERIINRELRRLSKVREEFMNMDEKTY